ncbi:MAG TPA: hypothetical protein ENL05_00270 [Candidatus Moranbacteria bacterium]|nr:hypothetical protein [Candidatus Moranbacteria bacterium]
MKRRNWRNWMRGASYVLGIGTAYFLVLSFMLMAAGEKRVWELFIISILLGGLAIAIWPKEAQEKKKKKLQLPKKKKKFYSRPTLYVGRSKDSLM